MFDTHKTSRHEPRDTAQLRIESQATVRLEKAAKIATTFLCADPLTWLHCPRLFNVKWQLAEEYIRDIFTYSRASQTVLNKCIRLLFDMELSQPSPLCPSSPKATDQMATKSCFICFETADETPDQTWVTPCPCTLDAHESCMLQWIAETESSGGARKKLRCPACNSRIRVTEPWDPIVALGDRYSKVYGRASYFVLASTLMTMGVVGSGYYGLQSMLSFAGPQPTLNWLGLRKIVISNSRYPPFSWKDGAILVWKFYLLNLVAPFLLFHRALPNLGDAAAVGVSCLVSNPPPKSS